MQLFIGNLSFDAKDSDLMKFFEGHGLVMSAKVVMKKNKKKSRGFGFVEIPDEAQAKAVIAALDGKELMGRVVSITEVQPTAKTVKTNRKKSKGRSSEAVIGAGNEDEFISEDSSGSESDEEDSDEEASEIETEENFNKEGAGEEPKEAGRSYRYNRKHDDRARPSRGGERPWSNREGAPRPYARREGSSGYQSRPEGESRYYKKPEGGYRGRSLSQSAKPWEKRESGSRPYGRPEGGLSTRGRSDRESKPWTNREENFDKRTRPRSSAGKPYEKREGNTRANRPSKPWDNRPPRGGSGFRGRPDGESRPYVKHERGSTFRGSSEGSSKPYEKREGNYRRTKPAYSAKPWKKPEGSFKPRSESR